MFLEKGEESDRYDFLDMYLKRWRRVAQRIEDNCALQRNLKVHNETVMDVDYMDDEEIDDHGRVLAQNNFHPYDWIKKVETEVRRPAQSIIAP